MFRICTITNHNKKEMKLVLLFNFEVKIICWVQTVEHSAKLFKYYFFTFQRRHIRSVFIFRKSGRIVTVLI